MSERNSEYARQPDDAYWTPAWVFDALHEAEKFYGPWDCAPRNADFDFLKMESAPSPHIVTNPPFALAEQFIRHALDLTREQKGKVAMLLPHAFDTARRRVDLFDRPPFKCKLTLLRRIRWENLRQKPAGPSKSHAWYLWDWSHTGPATMRLLETEGAATAQKNGRA